MSKQMSARAARADGRARVEAEKKKRGRRPLDKEQVTFTLDKKVVSFLKKLDDGARSRYVNDCLIRHLESIEGFPQA